MNAPIARTRAPLSKAMLAIEYLAEKSIKEVGVRNLARHLNISPAAAQGLIALMREAGFIERSDGDNATYVFSRRLLKVARDIAETSSYAGLAFETPERAMTGYVLARDAWGRGYATECMKAMIDVARQCGVKQLYALCHTDHAASWRVLEKCGLTRARVLRGHSEFPNLAPGTVGDVFRYELSL